MGCFVPLLGEKRREGDGPEVGANRVKCLLLKCCAVPFASCLLSSFSQVKSGEARKEGRLLERIGEVTRTTTTTLDRQWQYLPPGSEMLHPTLTRYPHDMQCQHTPSLKPSLTPLYPGHRCRHWGHGFYLPPLVNERQGKGGRSRGSHTPKPAVTTPRQTHQTDGNIAGIC